MSAESSGGVNSKVCLIPSIILLTESFIASSTSEEVISLLTGSPSSYVPSTNYHF